MENKIIRGAANIYYKAYVEGEPLTHETPIECFEAGAQFVIDSQKARNNCNIPEGTSYKQKKIMDKKVMSQIIGKVEKMIKVTGFHITAPGDDSVGIPSASWELKNDFFFDDQKELDDFKTELKGTFEWYCGEVTSVVSFEEYEAELEAELIEEYKQFPVRYLVKSKDYTGSYMRPAPLTGMYSSDVAECIHFELEDWIKESRGSDVIIPSTSDEYWIILKKALAEKQQSLNVNSQHYHGAKSSVQLLLKELHYGISDS